MEVDLTQWRARIGTFCQPRRHPKFKLAAITLDRPSALLRLAVIMSLLFLAGDVELNPGPARGGQSYSQSRLQFGDLDSTFRRTTRLASSVAREAAGSHGEIDNVQGFPRPVTDQQVRDNNTDRTDTRIDTSREDILEKIWTEVSATSRNVEKINRRFDSLERKLDEDITALRKENDYLNGRIDELEQQQDNLEAQSRRNNLIFKGIKESERESWADTEEKVRSFMIDKLSLSKDQADEIEIERAHRLPGRSGERLVIAKLLKYKDKEFVLKSAREKLRGEISVSVREDYTKRVREIRSRLFPFMKRAREKGDLASLSYDKLRINGELFCYDFMAADIKPMRRRYGTTDRREFDARQTLPNPADRPGNNEEA